MLLNACALLMSFVALFSMVVSSSAAKTIERSDLAQVFAQSNVQGTFVVFDLGQNEMILVNSQRAQQLYIPASTFKIVNSLIALETGVVRDENEIVPYGGKPQPIKAWEKDMSIRDAIKVSNVPVYQEIAKRVGKTLYLEWLKRLGYGNHLVGDDVQSFWLNGPLEISAIEQARFLARLAKMTLPMSKRSQSKVIDIVKLQQNGTKTLFGKTGWTNAPDPDIGWFVGWIKDGGEIHTFALNIDIRSRADAKLRIPLARKLLNELGVF